MTPAKTRDDRRREFIERHFHSLYGVVVDAMVSGRRDELASKWLTAQKALIESRLGVMFDALVPADPVANGAPKEAVKR